ncbi:MAG: VWA domain-containing protein [Oscillospiraceae bacterium]|nr:VWA domain-containing protein [Oscillospiraceae bacterium]
MSNNKNNATPANAGNNVTELVFILDRSGSMSGLESDTIGGFNAMLDKQKKQDGKCFVTTVLFDDRLETLHDRLALERVAPLTDSDYTVRGCTALLDAIGSTIRHIVDIHRYQRPEDVPEHTVFVITTDGMENASRRYSSDEVKRMIEKEKEQYGWEFLFLAANIDAVETAKRFGINEDRAVNYHADRIGTRLVYETVGEAVCSVRACAPMKADWSEKLNRDFKSRKKQSR